MVGMMWNAYLLVLNTHAILSLSGYHVHITTTAHKWENVR